MDLQYIRWDPFVFERSHLVFDNLSLKEQCNEVFYLYFLALKTLHGPHMNRLKEFFEDIRLQSLKSASPRSQPLKFEQYQLKIFVTSIICFLFFKRKIIYWVSATEEG